MVFFIWVKRWRKYGTHRLTFMERLSWSITAQRFSRERNAWSRPRKGTSCRSNGQRAGMNVGTGNSVSSVMLENRNFLNSLHESENEYLDRVIGTCHMIGSTRRNQTRTGWESNERSLFFLVVVLCFPRVWVHTSIWCKIWSLVWKMAQFELPSTRVVGWVCTNSWSGKELCTVFSLAFLRCADASVI